MTKLRRWYDRFSLLWQLELAIGSLLIIVVVALTTSAYFQLKSSDERSAEERLARSANEVATNVSDAVQRTLRVPEAIAERPALRAYLTERTPDLRDAALTVLREDAARPAGVLGVELVDDEGQVLLSSYGDSGQLPGVSPRELANAADSAVAGWLTPWQGDIVIPVLAPVMSEGERLGWVAIWFPLQLTLRVGELRAYIGNRDGSLWFDLDSVVAQPSPQTVVSGSAVWYERGDSALVSAAHFVPQTPWIVLVEDSQQNAFEQLTWFLRRISLLGGLLLALGLSAVSILARRITSPLRTLTKTSEKMSAGDYSSRVPEEGSRELFSLATSFNTMAERVEEGLARLGREAIERRQAQESLHSAHERLRAIVESVPIAIYSLDSERLVQIWNPAAERIFGWPAADVLGKRLPFHPENVPTPDSLPAEPATHEAPLIGEELTRVRKDGSKVQIRRYTAPLYREDGQVAGVMVAATDISDLQRLEHQYRQAQKMEAVGRLAGGVAHDFNNLLTVILAEAGLAMSDVGQEHPVRPGLEEITRAGRAAAELTGQLLAFSRQQIVESTTFSLTDLIEDLAKMLRRLLGEDVTLVTRLSSVATPVNADRSQFEQLIMNLAVNARDAMPDGGVLTIESGTRFISPEDTQRMPGLASGEYVTLAFSDSGTGMTEDVRSHIFEPFFTTKEFGHGTGLGLAMCYGIVAQAGGHIEVYSEPNVGTTFTIYVPRAAGALPAPVAITTPAPPTGSERILLVEDQDAVRHVAIRILERLGYEVVGAPDAEHALGLLENDREHFDLLLTDVVLPRMKGGELANHARAMRPEMKVIFASGYTSDVAAYQKLVEEDAVLVQKPFTAAHLAKVIRTTLDG